MTINGKVVEAQEGQFILEVARENGIGIQYQYSLT